MSKPRLVGHRELVLDAGTIGLVSIAISLAAHRLAVMDLVVGLVFAARFCLWTRIPREERLFPDLSRELVFWCFCAILGGFNDWNTVVNHGVYEYTVPAELPRFSTIPLWMLLYWGQILRALVSLSTHEWFASKPRNGLRMGKLVFESRVGRVLFEVALILVTRQAIYRYYRDPVLSWGPFAAALLVAFVVLMPDRNDVKLIGVVALVGSLLEMLYIQVGGLHRYHLGWLAGVPVWIALWWLLAVLLWKDLAERIVAEISRAGTLTGYPNDS